MIDLATRMEALVSNLNRSRVLVRIVEIRTAAAGQTPEWSHSRFEAERASIERLIGDGRHSEAARAAQALHLKCEAVGGTAYDGAAYDGAVAQVALGRALQMRGSAEAALPHLEQARQRLERLNATRMAGVALTDKADCLKDLGRYEEAAEAYQQTIATMERVSDPRSGSAVKIQLATVRLLQKNLSEALRLYTEAREVFERLNEPTMVATVWHQIGRVYQEAGKYELAEQAYQKSLSIKVQIGNRAAQASTLTQLAHLYSALGRPQEAIRLHRQAADIDLANGDLRNEGIDRNNIASELTTLRRFDEARVEVERAIECDRPFGHVAEPWETFAILSNLELAAGNQPAALEARAKAINAYLAYRRDGGAPQIDVSAIPPGLDPADPEVPYRVAAEILVALGESASAS
ncbi:MAG TPA: tetratricopeptide repeat protein [Bryobacteraceae bacterium]